MRILLGDLRDVLPTLEPESLDACVCDPPYELDFMGKRWDSTGVSFQAETWEHVLRVLKPGGHLLAFGGTRTYHRIAVAIEDAGFDVRDQIAWMYGSGFPKSLDVAKAIDRALGATGDYAGVRPGHEDFVERDDPSAAGGRSDGWTRPWQDDPEARERHHLAYEPATEAARERQGWGTALKPAYEPIVVARKPLVGTVAANVIAHGVGAINVDACRIEGVKDVPASPRRAEQGSAYGDLSNDSGEGSGWDPAVGRWPANVILGHSPDCVQVGVREVASDGHYPAARPGGVEVGTVGHAGQEGLVERHTRGETVEAWECVPDCPVRLLDEQSGDRPGMATQVDTKSTPSRYFGLDKEPGLRFGRGDSGGASRFFYCAKTSRAERNAGLDGFQEGESVGAQAFGLPDPRMSHEQRRLPGKNAHPTVKPIDLMRWLLRLVVPPGGTVLDPFLGSGTTGCAAALEGLDLVGVELDPDYLRIAEARIAFWAEYGEDGLRIVAERAAGERARLERAATGQLDLLGETA